MFSWLKSATQSLPTSRVCTPGDRDGNGVADSNQAVQDDMGSDFSAVGDSFLDLLAPAAEQGGFASTPKFENATENDDFLSMGGTDANYAFGTHSVSAKMVESKREVADEFLGTRTSNQHSFATFDGDRVTVGMKEAAEWMKTEDGPSPFSTTFDAAVSSDGVVQGGGSVKVGDFGASAKAMLDLDERGQIEALAASGSLDVAGAKYKAGGSYKPTTIERDGNTVSWAWSGSADAGVEVFGVGGGAGAKGGTQRTASFRTPLEAEQFVAQLEAGEARGADELDSAQLDAMAPGTSMSYTSDATLSVEGTYFAGVGVENASKQSIQVERGEGSAVTLTLETTEDTTGSGKVSNGVASVSGSTGHGTEQVRVFELDLSNAAHREAFDVFQQTGKLPNVPMKEGHDFEDIKSERSMAVPGFSVKQSSSHGKGTVTEDGREFDAARATNAEEVSTTNGWDMLYGGAKFLADYCPMPMTRVAGMAYTEYADSPAERKSVQGSRDGTLTGTMVTHQPKDATDKQRWMNTIIEQTEYIDMADRREAAKAFWDAETPLSDHDEIEHVRPLPPNEIMDRKWKLETLIDEQGSFNVLDHLIGRDNKHFRMEREGAMAVQPAKDAFAGDTSPDGYMDALALMHDKGGPDALEGIRDAATQKHLERFVSLEGDSTWLDRRANEKLDNRTDTALATESAEMCAALLDSEKARRQAILEGDYLEIPPSLRDAELDRIDSRIARLEAGN